MVKNKLIYLMLLFLSFSIFSIAQQKKIEEKKDELSSIRRQITDLENQVKQKSKNEKETYTTLANYDKQKFLLNKLINNLHQEENEKQKEITKSQAEITALGNEIKTLKENYSKYVVSIYKYGKPEELALIFDSNSFQQALLRFKYLQKFTEKRKDDLEELKAGINRLTKIKLRLQKEKKEKELLAKQKEEEQNILREKMKEGQKILAAIRHDKTELRNEINAKKGAELKIKSLIAKLIDEENRKREEAERLAKSKSDGKNKTTIPEGNYDIDLSTSGFSSFTVLKGKLNWPVQKAKIIRQFGENRNSKLNTVSLNYGVDMKVLFDLNVKVVADGVVSAIDWIPGYGSVIIVTHKGDFRTVYSHLGEIFVNEGDKLISGNLIGKVGESLEGNVLHFEIWNSRNNQDPEIWLAKK